MLLTNKTVAALGNGTTYRVRITSVWTCPYPLVHFLEKSKAFLNVETYSTATGDLKYGNKECFSSIG